MTKLEHISFLLASINDLKEKVQGIQHQALSKSAEWLEIAQKEEWEINPVELNNIDKIAAKEGVVRGIRAYYSRNRHLGVRLEVAKKQVVEFVNSQG
jgi:hypothetical protein